MKTIHARPYDYTFEPARTAVVMIDMQRDFLEPGGFGAMLGNDVSQLRPIVPACVQLLALARANGMAVIHTQEAHDTELADCPPSKRARGQLGLRHRRPRPAGARARRRRAGRGLRRRARSRSPATSCCASPARAPSAQPGSTASCTPSGITHLLIGGVTTEVCVQTTMREANDRGYECLLVDRLRGELLPAVPRRRRRDGGRAGRHRRLGGAARGGRVRVRGRALRCC